MDGRKVKCMICVRCGRTYTCRPALSRVDGETMICPVCGVEEAVAAFDGETKEKILSEIEAAEIAAGRIN